MLSHIADLFSLKYIALSCGNLHCDRSLLVSSVCIQERAADIHDGLSSPVHHKPWRFCDYGNGNCLQVFLCHIGHHLLNILFVYHNGHSLLGLGNGNLRSVQSRIFLRHLVKVNLKSCCQLADGHRYTAGAEVVALLDQAAYLRTAE